MLSTYSHIFSILTMYINTNLIWEMCGNTVTTFVYAPFHLRPFNTINTPILLAVNYLTLLASVVTWTRMPYAGSVCIRNSVGLLKCVQHLGNKKISLHVPICTTYMPMHIIANITIRHLKYLAENFWIH